MRATILIALGVILAAIAVPSAEAACAAETASAIAHYDSQNYQSAKQLCGAASNCATYGYFGGGSQPASGNAEFEMCTDPPGTTSTACCPDECFVRQTTSCITSDNLCMLVPGPGSRTQCMVRDKVCAYMTNNETACNRYSFCSYTNAQCRFALPSMPSVPPGESVKDKCAALHPVVIAMLALMFVTFIGAVVLVAVVVYNNQRKFDEEEKHREIAQAAAAEAKRARGQRNRL